MICNLFRNIVSYILQIPSKRRRIFLFHRVWNRFFDRAWCNLCINSINIHFTQALLNIRPWIKGESRGKTRNEERTKVEDRESATSPRVGHADEYRYSCRRWSVSRGPRQWRSLGCDVNPENEKNPEHWCIFLPRREALVSLPPPPNILKNPISKSSARVYHKLKLLLNFRYRNTWRDKTASHRD